MVVGMVLLIAGPAFLFDVVSAGEICSKSYVRLFTFFPVNDCWWLDLCYFSKSWFRGWWFVIYFLR